MLVELVVQRAGTGRCGLELGGRGRIKPVGRCSLELAGGKFEYPEVKDLSKTHLNEIGKGAKLTADLPDPVVSNLGADVSFVKSVIGADAGCQGRALKHLFSHQRCINIS